MSCCSICVLCRWDAKLERNNVIGHVPANYLRILPQQASNQNNTVSTPTAATSNTATPTSPSNATNPSSPTPLRGSIIAAFPSSRGSFIAPISTATVTALYPYTAQRPTEISFTAGEVLTLVVKEHPDWWKLKNDSGSQGLAPSNYIKENTATPTESVTTSKASSVASPRSRSSIMSSWNENSPSATNYNAASTTPSGEQYEAMFDFTATGDGQLSLQKGEIITVTKKEEHGWFTAVSKTGKSGIVPSNYLKAVESSASSAPLSSASRGSISITPTSRSSISVTSPVGYEAVALYDYNGQTAAELSVSAGEVIRVSGPTATSADWLQCSSSNGTLKGIVPTTYVTKVLGRAKCLYDYTGVDDSQLSFNVNDVIVITERDEQSGWGSGVLRGKTGLFALNYTQPL